MNADGRKSRVSVSRGGATLHSTPASAPFFSESPVPLPSLDTLRTTDILVRAYYVSLAPSSSMTPPAADTSAVKECVRPAEIAIAAGAQKTDGEVFCAALAREVVEAAANLFASRSLDRLVGAYAACAAWDDMRDVVATSFLLQDHGDSVIRTHRSGSLVFANGLPPSSSEATTATAAALTPLFLRSALSLAGVSTRTPSCTLTPQSLINPPPLSTYHRSATQPTHLSCPVPPASVPMDAYCRYVMAVEEAPAPPIAPDAVPSSHHSTLLRLRSTRRGTRHLDKSAAESAAPLSLSPSLPPPRQFKRLKRGKRLVEKHLPRASLEEALSESGGGARSRLVSTTSMQAPLSDALTTAMRQAPLPLLGDNAESLSHAERAGVRVVGIGDTTAQPGGSETERKHMVKASLRNGGAMLAVEQDRLWTMERGRVVPTRRDRRKDGVVCRVEPPPSSDTDAAIQDKEPVAPAEAATKDDAGETLQQRRGTWRRASAAAMLEAKEATLALEAWTSSFYSTADVPEEIPLQDQVQVYPSAGVTVMETNNSGTTSSLRRSKKADASHTVVACGGPFAVPADRMALSSFDDKRPATRKSNGGLSRTQQPHRDKTRRTRAVKSAVSRTASHGH
ncbi:hypothetical protein, unknown function [Leishmania tarentolae]|uniref:Uncharacterized protein n=1 Tax=Leishmania tarentolae TaxID=5689 RepID=A0A640KQP3_LEITA|nr:hypothetical protein, unknown function [Leishmania tarentolae]